MTDPINSLDDTSLSELDQLEIAKLRAAHDRGGPQAVAEGMARLVNTNPDLFAWLVKKLSE